MNVKTEKVKKYIVLAFLSIITFYSCSDDDAETILNFRLEYEGEPFVFFKDYSYPDGKTFNLTRLSFYISDIQLSSTGQGSSSSVPEYLDFTNSHADESKAMDGFDLPMQLSPDGDITGVSFSIGLNEELNATVPNIYPSSHAMSRSAEYWASWNSYIFAKIEGNIDLDGDQVKETGVVLHLGSDEAFRTININGLANTDNVDLVIEVKDIFQNGSDIFDIETTHKIHNLSQMAESNILMDNLVSAIRAR